SASPADPKPETSQSPESTSAKSLAQVDTSKTKASNQTSVARNKSAIQLVSATSEDQSDALESLEGAMPADPEHSNDTVAPPKANADPAKQELQLPLAAPEKSERETYPVDLPMA